MSKELQGNARKLKEQGIKKSGSDRKPQDLTILTWEKAGSTRIHEELGGNDRKGRDYKGCGRIYWELKEIVLFKALHLVLSDKSRESGS
jgi:hypothetical protein